MVRPFVAPFFILVALLLGAGAAAADADGPPDGADGSPEDDQGQGSDGQGSDADGSDADGQGGDEEGPGDGEAGDGNETSDGSLVDRLSERVGATACPLVELHAGNDKVPVGQWVVLDPQGCYNETIRRILGITISYSLAIRL